MAAKSEDGEQSIEVASKRLQFKIASRAAISYRRALWAATVHYTWWLLAIAAALVYAGTSVDTGFWVRVAVVLVGCVAGFVLALIALRVLRREGECLNGHFEVYDRLANELGLEEPTHAAPTGRANKGLWGLIRGVSGRNVQLETGDWFQFTFGLVAVVYAVAFVATLVYSLVK